MFYKRSRFQKRAQSTLEYALLVAAVVGGLLAMQIYAKRGVEGRLRGASDDIGEQFDADATSSSYTTTRTSTTKEVTTDGITSSYMGGTGGGAAETVTRTGSETVTGW